ncbi:MAG: RimK/LysX family protein [Syntrophales bacterium]
MSWTVQPLLISLFIILISLPPQAVGAEEDKVVGAVENIILMPRKITLPARIDTGAATTSLDARELVIRGNMAEFHLSETWGGEKMKLPVKGWKKIKGSENQQRRPVVELDICIGDRLLRVEVNLMDRSRLQYPLLVGRDVLGKGFIVDVRKMHALPPRCPETSRP